MPRPTTLLLLVTALAACSVLGLDGNREEQAELARARARWEQMRPYEYSYVLERLCFCGAESVGPVRIVVRGGSVLSRTYTATGEPVLPQFAAAFGPIDSLFVVIGRALENGADELTARYHSHYGHPLDVDIDYLENAVDDELVLHVREFAQRGPSPGAR
jgi:hypothetical protein